MKIKSTNVLLLFKKKLLIVMMRSFIFLLCTTVFSFNTENVLSQNVKVTIDADKVVTIDEIFDLIMDQTEYTFIYQVDMFKTFPKVTLKKGTVRANQLISKSLSNGKFDISFSDNNTIVIKEHIPNIIDNQQMISGTVIDEQGIPLAGVNVLIVGTNAGTQTDFDGNYSIGAASGDILEFSYVGMQTEQVTVGNNTTINVTMNEDVSKLEEVVLVGYGTRKVAKVSGAVNTISTKALENRMVRNIGEALQGTAANLNVNISDGRATTVPNINIRGFESINGGSPLIIIDGVSASASDLARLNPADVEAISVLKDAASAGIYGARASFGVLLVKTKQGKGKMRVDYNEIISLRQPTFLPEVELNPEIVLRAKHDAAYPYYDLYSDAMYEYAARVWAGEAPAVYLNPNNQRYWEYYGSTDWFKEAYNNTALSINRNLSISGKNDKTAYYFSLGSFREDGAIKNGTDKYKRYNLRSKVGFDVTDWLTVTNNTSWESTNYDEPSGFDHWRYFHELNRSPSTGVVYNPDGSYTDYGAELIGVTKDGGRRTEIDNIIATQFATEISIIKDLWKVNADYTVRKSYENVSNFRKPVPYKTGPNEPVQYQYGQDRTTFAARSNDNSTYKAINLFTTINKEFNKHAFTGTFGYNQEENTYRSFGTRRDELITTSLPSLELATGDTFASEGYSSWAVRGAFGRLGYSFDDKYILEVSGRYDGSSRFPKADRFVFNPTFSAAWRIDKESFMQNQSVVSLLKPRFSWGRLGNQNVSDFPYIASMSSGRTNKILDGDQRDAIYQPGLVASSLTWETVETKNFGLDLELFKGKIFTQFDIYERLTLDMLTKSKTLPAILGTSEPNENAADLKNRGWGVSVTWNESINLGKSPLTFSLTANLSDSRTWITDFDNPDAYIGDYYIGQEIGEIWGLTSDGLFQSAEEVQNYAFEDHRASDEIRYMAVGDVKWKDLDGDGIINFGSQRVGDTGDFRVIGNTQERYRYGINLNLNWNSFDLRVFGQGVGKRDYYPSRGSHYFWGIYAQPWANPTKHILDNMWTPENTDAYFPRLKAYAAEDYSELGIPQTRYLIDASYFRIKNITLGYTLPRELLEKINVNTLRIYFSGENLFTFSDITKFGMDPEALTGTGQYPQQKKFSFGVNLSL